MSDTNVRRVVADLRAALDQAKEGPWRVADNGEDVVSESQGVVADAYVSADAAAIVALRNAAPALLDALDRVAQLAEEWAASSSGVLYLGVAATDLRATLAAVTASEDQP